MVRVDSPAEHSTAFAQGAKHTQESLQFYVTGQREEDGPTAVYHFSVTAIAPCPQSSHGPS